MSKCRLTAASLAAVALVGAATSFAVPVSRPVYTFCENEDNDLCENFDRIDADDAVSANDDNEEARDCFFITGKLQKDCVWDIQPKCALRHYGKPEPCYTAGGPGGSPPLPQPIPGVFREPLLDQSNTGALYEIEPVERIVRLGVAALMDATDGTINGLAQNDPHGELGEVTIKVFYNTGEEGEGPGGALTGKTGYPDQVYVWRFLNGADALRVAFEIPRQVEEDLRGDVDVTSVDVLCCNDTGTVGICWDVDFYKIRNLIDEEPYCITVIGGLDEDCEKTDTILGWYDKNCNPIGGADGVDDDGGQGVYSELCVFADGRGDIRFAVSGSGDANFNGLLDSVENDYFTFLFVYNLTHDGEDFEHRPGASTKDDSYVYVNRYPRSVWDEEGWTQGNPIESLYDHGVCGEYCIKVRRGLHADSPDPDDGPALVGAARADMNQDGVVNAGDLAVLLSHWGVVQ